ncbi:hypothetical protein FYJ57_14710 [Lachnospiraceae bacterium BSM-380-WT-5A]|uniref:Uncharacterized protein n=1 Tax=Oliverpabstia intestinalis TaxID=2606633 RepID=A0A7X2TNC9_9FIRM|nr:hypothetical protein [Oliverpabstia intestinalis]MST67915.1 hypothetical protein [Oliverpabstia intestinalis]
MNTKHTIFACMYGFMGLIMTILTIICIAESDTAALISFYLICAVLLWVKTIQHVKLALPPVIPIGMRYENLCSLVDELADFAHAGDYASISITLDPDYSCYSTFVFKTACGEIKMYDIIEHGYTYTTAERMVEIFKKLNNRLSGYMVYDYNVIHSRALNDPIPDNIYLFLGETARKKRMDEEQKRLSDINRKQL